MIFYGTTDIGMKREVNQDNFRIKELSEDITLAIVCDGMGGARGGGVASALAVSSFMDFINKNTDEIIKEIDSENADEIISEILHSAVKNANDVVFSASNASSELKGMGTTLVCALITPKRIYSVNVGDSRMYLYNDKDVTQITRDHSYVQYLVDIGRLTPRKAKSSAQKNIITRAVGTEDFVEADLFTLQHKSNGKTSVIVLCSDGLSNMIEIRDIIKYLEKVNGNKVADLKKAADNLVSLANERGGNDNITVVLLAY